MKSIAAVLLAFAPLFAQLQMIDDGDFQVYPPNPWTEIQSDSCRASSFHPRDTTGDCCGLTDASIHGSDSVVADAQLRQVLFCQAPVWATFDFSWDICHRPGESGGMANFGLLVVAKSRTDDHRDSLLYQYGAAGLQAERPDFGVVTLDTAPAGEWHRFMRQLADDWRAAGLTSYLWVEQVVLYSEGMDTDSAWLGQEVRWDSVSLYCMNPGVEQPSHPTRPSALRVWPTISRGPVHYESSSPVFLHDATGRRLAVFPSGRGRAAAPSRGVFFLKSGGETVRVTNL